MRRFLLRISLIVVFLLIPSSSFASTQYRILGASTASSNLQIPPTVEGPGLILPDSPLFFLDQLKQSIRLLTAFTPDEKAKTYTQIAGERLAELRFMLGRNNQKGIDFGINGVSDNLKYAVSQVSQAQLSGRDISTLAKEINDSIKAKREALWILEKDSGGSLKIKVAAAQRSLLESKIEVENSLDDADLENEVKDDLAFEIQRKVSEASESAKDFNDDLAQLKEEAKDAAQKSLKRREEVLKRAIEEKNDSLRKTEERRFEEEKKKQELALKVQGQAVEEARRAVEQAKEAANKFQEAWKKTVEIKTASSSSM